VKSTGDSLALRLVTPMDNHIPKSHNSHRHHSHKGRSSPHSTNSSLGSSTPRSSSSSSSGYGGSYGRSVSRNTGSTSPHQNNGEGDSTMKKLTKTLFRKTKSREKVNEIGIGGYKSNVILRWMKYLFSSKIIFLILRIM